jgi:rod shape-determining protein MreC
MWCLLVLSVVLMISDHQYNRLVHVREAVLLGTSPLQWAVHLPIRFIQKFHGYFISHHQLLEENIQLRDEHLVQNGRLQQLVALEAENARLRALLQSSERRTELLTVAEIMQVDADPFNHRILLNKGEHDHVVVGQPIIDADGVMGEIIEVHPFTSSAILVSDASHAIPVENVRNGVRGILVGIGAIDCLELQYVPTTADIQVGDILVTSGLGGRYPPGYPVGVISHIEYDPSESFAIVRVTPSAHLERGRQVLLVKSQEKLND